MIKHLKKTQHPGRFHRYVFICQTERAFVWSNIFFFECTQFLTLLCRLEPNQPYYRYVFYIVIDTQSEEVRNDMWTADTEVQRQDEFPLSLPFQTCEMDFYNAQDSRWWVQSKGYQISMICNNIMCLWTSLLFITVQSHTSCKLPASYVAACWQEVDNKDQSKQMLTMISLFGMNNSQHRKCLKQSLWEK